MILSRILNVIRRNNSLSHGDLGALDSVTNRCLHAARAQKGQVSMLTGCLIMTVLVNSSSSATQLRGTFTNVI